MSTGNLYVADYGNNKIRRVDRSGYVSTLAGSGLIGTGNGEGTSASLYGPRGVVLDGFGTLFVSEWGSGRIRSLWVSPGDLPLCDNKWHHVALVHGDTDGFSPESHKAYIDGKWVDEGAFPQALPVNSRLSIGGNGDASYYDGEPFAGIVDDVRIFAHSLYEYEVQALAVPALPVIANASMWPPASPDATAYQWVCAAGFAGAAKTLYTKSVADNSWAVLPSSSVSCAPCSGATYALAGSPACSPCSPASGSFGSSGSSCTPFAMPGAGLSFFHSCDAAETLGALAVTAPGGATFVADRNGNAGRALQLAAGSYARLYPNSLPSLAMGNSAMSIAAWVKCAAPALPGVAVGVGAPADVTGERFALFVGAAPGAYPAQLPATAVAPVTPANPASTLITAGATGNALALALDPSSGGAYAYVADTAGNRILRVTMSTGAVIVAAGGGPAAWVDGDGSSAFFNSPRGVAVDQLGTVYVADSLNHCIRKVSRVSGKPDAYTVATWAGSGSTSAACSSNLGCVDGGGTAASFNTPVGLAFDSYGWLYVAEKFRIRSVDPFALVSTWAGTGATGTADGDALAAACNGLTSIAMDAAGNAIVVDAGNHRVRKLFIATDRVTTLVGAPGASTSGFADNVAGTSARLLNPSFVALDALGQAYISDSGNGRLRRLDTGGIVTTVAGSGSTTGTVDAASVGPAGAVVAVPQGLAVDASGSVVFFDSLGRNLRRFSAAPAPLPVCDGAWHHVALTHGDGGADVTKVYVDGALQVTQTWHLNVAPDAALFVGWNGKMAVNSGERFAGQLDDVALYGRALTAAEVSAIVAAAPTAAPSVTPTSSFTPSQTGTPSSTKWVPQTRTP